MNVTIRLRNIFYAVTIILVIWFLLQVHQILTPFIIAMMFAYIFNPLINFFSNKIKIPRTLSILLVYIILIASVIATVSLITQSIVRESVSIRNNLESFFSNARHDLAYSPNWIKPFFQDFADYFSRNPLASAVASSPFPFFTKAFSGILTFFAFLFAAFFFLKDYKKMLEKIVSLAPLEYRGDFEILIKRINNVLSSYLRGQIILIISMIVMLLICFYILGIKYMMTIAVFSAVFEIVPILGPIVAGVLGTFVIVATGGIQNFEFDTITAILIIAAIYYVSRQIQDYLIAPFVIGKATKLHPLIILFSVFAGEHIGGILGVLLAVPIAASIKISYQFITERIRGSDERKRISKKSN